MRSLPVITFSDLVSIFGAGFGTGVVLTAVVLVLAAYIQEKAQHGRR